MSGGVALSHSGKQHSYRVALALQAAAALDAFYTSAYYKRDRFPDRLARLAPPLDRWLRRRWQEGLDPRSVRRHPSAEFPEIFARAMGASESTVALRVARRDMAFDEWVAAKMHTCDSRAAWGFQGSCFHTLAAARDRGMTAVLEVASIPAQVIRALMAAEPDAVPSREDLDPEYRRRTEAEPLRADFCVAASSFCARALESIGVPRERIRLLPLGADVRRFRYENRQTRAPLRVLFVGKRARHKGLAYLVAAMKGIDTATVQLTIVGPAVGEDTSLALSSSGATVLDAVSDIERVYRDHDVLVLPSLYEGFGLVVVEAMATGMPVIATENTCGPDVIRHGVDGFIVPPRDAEAIADRLEWCAHHRGQLAEMGSAAAQRAAEYSWEAHAARVGAFAREILGRAA